MRGSKLHLGRETSQDTQDSSLHKPFCQEAFFRADPHSARRTNNHPMGAEAAKRSFGASTSANCNVSRLSRLATGGKRPEHCERDLHALAGQDLRVNIQEIRLPIKNISRRQKNKKHPSGVIRAKTLWINWPVLPTWDVSKFICQSGGFRSWFVPDERVAEAFCTDFAGLPYADHHSIQGYSRSDYRRIVPLHFHIDGT